jgi:Flp pilus assembly protein TadD
MKSTDRALLITEGLAFHRRGDLENAGLRYSEVLEQEPQSAEALHLFGVVIYQMGDPRAGIRAIERAIAIRPNVWHWHWNLGEIYRSLGSERHFESCRYFAWKLRPEGQNLPTDFDLLIHADGIGDEVARPGPRLARQRSARSAGLLGSGRRLAAEGDLLRARSIFEALVPLDPDHVDAWNELGEVDRRLGYSIESRSSFFASLRLEPGQVEILNSMGRNLVEAGEPIEALAWFRLALESEPGSVPIRANLAWTLRELGELEQGDPPRSAPF